MRIKPFIAIMIGLGGGALAGCGPSREETVRREQQRLEQERQAQEAIRKSNEAVNEVSRKLGKKPPAFDLGVPPPTQPVTPAPAQPKP